MATGTTIVFDLFDVTAREDSQPNFSEAEAFGHPEDFRREDEPAGRWATLETDYFLLDGSFMPFPDAPGAEDMRFWSRAASGPDGAFAAPPALPITFGTYHSSLGLTLRFWPSDEDWASEVHIQWFDGSGISLGQGLYFPDRPVFFCEKKVENYQAVTLRFIRTSRPGRRVRLTGIDYGARLTFADEDIVHARVLEEVDLISNQLKVSTLDLGLFSESEDFSLLNKAGFHSLLQHKQQFRVQERVDGGEIAIGTFYLSEIGNATDKTAVYSAVNEIGLLDGVPHLGGIYDTTAAAFAAQLLQGYAYELDTALAGIPVKGYLPVGTLRSALQQFAFAICAVVDASRTGVIRIYPPPSRPSSMIGMERMFVGGDIVQRPLITGVQVYSYSYSAGAGEVELFKAVLEAGIHTLHFAQPAHSLQAQNAAICESGPNFAVISVAAVGEVTLTGKGYDTGTTLLERRAEQVPPNSAPNVLKVDKATLVCPGRAEAVAANILAYHAGRVEQSFRMLAGAEVLADTVIIRNNVSRKVKAVIESMDIDLAGGFIAKVVVVGTQIDTRQLYYTGTDLYTGEGGLI